MIKPVSSIDNLEQFKESVVPIKKQPKRRAQDDEFIRLLMLSMNCNPDKGIKVDRKI